MQLLPSSAILREFRVLEMEAKAQRRPLQMRFLEAKRIVTFGTFSLKNV